MDFELLSSLFASLSPLKIREHLCSRLITPRSACKKCIEACPLGSIGFGDDNLEVGKCCYCGKCVSACPNHVFKLEEEVLLEGAGRGRLILACSPVMEKLKVNKGNITKVNCFAQLFPELIIKLMVLSKQDIFLFIPPGFCENCLNFRVDSVKEQLACYQSISNNNFLKSLRILTSLEEFLQENKPGSEHSQYQARRREFFRSIFSGSKELPRQLLYKALKGTDPPKTQDMAKELPQKKQYLLESLREHPPDNLSRLLPYRGLSSTKCMFCDVCSKLCPTGALKIIKTNNQKSLAFIPHLCTECGICKDVCILQGLNFDKSIRLQDFLSAEPQILMSGLLKQCELCGESYWTDSAGEAKNCPWCSKLGKLE
ncbi:MAG: 4Fe-4S binding protein [Bacillota bacterium]